MLPCEGLPGLPGCGPLGFPDSCPPGPPGGGAPGFPNRGPPGSPGADPSGPSGPFGGVAQGPLVVLVHLAPQDLNDHLASHLGNLVLQQVARA